MGLVVSAMGLVVIGIRVRVRVATDMGLRAEV